MTTHPCACCTRGVLHFYLPLLYSFVCCFDARCRVHTQTGGPESRGCEGTCGRSRSRDRCWSLRPDVRSDTICSIVLACLRTRTHRTEGSPASSHLWGDPRPTCKAEGWEAMWSEKYHKYYCECNTMRVCVRD
jgi:hypothetical protein